MFIDGPPDMGYADYNAPDWSADHKTHVPLSDFFGSTQYNFTNIQTLEPYTCFQDSRHVLERRSCQAARTAMTGTERTRHPLWPHPEVRLAAAIL
jgi:hypothetical protein